MQIFLLRKVTLCSHINSVPWMYAVTPTPYHDFTQFVVSVKSLSFSLAWGFFGPIAYIHVTKLVWPRKVTLRSQCTRVRSWYGVYSIPFLSFIAQSKVQGFFSNRLNWDHPDPSTAGECVPPSFGSGGGGGGTLACVWGGHFTELMWTQKVIKRRLMVFADLVMVSL